MRPSLRRSRVFKCTLANLAGGEAAGLEGLREHPENPTTNTIAKTINLIPQAGKPAAASQVAIVHTGNNARAKSTYAVVPALRSVSAMNSSLVCAWAMWPGPKMMMGMPAAASLLPSQPKATVSASG